MSRTKKLTLLPHQKKFLLSDAPTLGLIGGIGTGKTDCAAKLVLIEHNNNLRDKKRGKKPRNGIITANTVSQLEKSLILAIQTLMQECDISCSYNSQKKILTIGELTTIYCFTLDKGTDNIRGCEASWLIMEEAAYSRDGKKSFDVLIGRLRGRVPRYKRFITSPNGKKNWIYKLLREEANEVNKDFFSKIVNGLRVEMIVARTRDNVYLPPDYEESMRSTYSTKFCLQELDSVFLDMNESAIFDSFSEGRDVDADLLLPPIRQRAGVGRAAFYEHQSGDSFQFPLYAFVDLNVDSYAVSMAYLTASESDPNDTVINVIDEFYESECSSFQMTEYVKSKYPAAFYGDIKVIIDCSSDTRKTSSKNLKTDMAIWREAGFIIINKGRTNPAITDSGQNVNRCLEKELFKIHPECKHGILDLNTCSKDDKGKIGKGTITHLSDGYRYGCWHFNAPKVKRRNANNTGFF